MPAELDHVFVWVSAGGPEADRLTALGLTEGKPNQHVGQGTACRRFFFEKHFLELIWVENPEEAQGPMVSPLRFWERWSGRASATCPFGLIFRPSSEGDAAPPFPAFEYRPPYLPPTRAFYAGTNAASVEEPSLFFMPWVRRPDTSSAEQRSPRTHEAGVRELAALRIIGPHPAPQSAAVQAVERTGAVVFRHGSEHLAEIGFDGERQGRRADLRPVLPLVICW
jgi:hypothetical protein